MASFVRQLVLGFLKRVYRQIMPLVGDQVEYLDKSKKSKGYGVVDGKTSQSIRGSFTSKHDGVKKKTSVRGLSNGRPYVGTKSVTVE